MLHAINLFKQKIFKIIESLHFHGYAFQNPSLAIDVYEKNLQLDSFVFFDYLFSRAYCFWCERKSCVTFVLFFIWHVN